MTRREQVTQTIRKFARIPDVVPAPRVWAMFASFIVGGIIALVGVGILYAGLRVYVESKGGAASLPIFGAGIVTFWWGANHASNQIARGSLAQSLGALVSPLRRLWKAATAEDVGENREGD